MGKFTDKLTKRTKPEPTAWERCTRMPGWPKWARLSRQHGPLIAPDLLAEELCRDSDADPSVLTKEMIEEFGRAHAKAMEETVPAEKYSKDFWLLCYLRGRRVLASVLYRYAAGRNGKPDDA